MLPRDLIKMARVISGHRDENIQDVYERHLRPSLTEEYRRVGREIDQTELGDTGS